MSELITNVRLSFPSLFKKSAFDDKATPKFSGMFIIEKNNPDVAKIKAAMKKAMIDKWGEKPQGLKLCLRDGSEKNDMDGFGPGVFFFNASSEKRPGVYDTDRSVLTEEDGRPYAGCYVNVRLSFWAQDNRYGKRINAELNGVQFAADGEAFGGGGAPAASDDFPELEPSMGEESYESTAEAAEDEEFDLLD
jgi:hypothetical protein